MLLISSNPFHSYGGSKVSYAGAQYISCDMDTALNKHGTLALGFVPCVLLPALVDSQQGQFCIALQQSWQKIWRRRTLGAAVYRPGATNNCPETGCTC